MHNAGDVVRIFEAQLTPFGGIGIAIAILLLIALRFTLPAQKKRLFRAPLGLLIAHVGFIALRAVLPHPPDSLRTPVDVTGLTLLLISIGRAGYLVLLYGVLERRRGPQKSLPGIIRDLLQVGLYGVIGLYVLSRAGVDPSSLLTTSAVLTAVIGFALQDTLSNLFAGLAIQLQEPFEVGDWIQFDDDSDHCGEVLEINWRATRILTNDRIEVIVPNNTLAKQPIRNFSRPSRVVRRHASVFAPIDTPPARVERLLLDAVLKVEGIRPQPSPDVLTREFSERGIEYRVRYFIEEYEQRDLIDGRVRNRLWYALRRAGIPIPMPHRRVTLLEHNAETAEREQQARLVDVEKALERIPLFKPLPAELLQELTVHTERRLYAPGEMVIQQGDHGEELFIVEKGNVEVLIDRPKGRERVATLGPRDFFGEMSLLTGEQRRATVRTQGEVSLLVVSKIALQPILEASPELATEMSEMLAQREVELGRASDEAQRGSEPMIERRGELLSRIRQFFSL